MAQAYAMALPGSLEKAAAAVGITQQKDLVGQRLMMQMAKPKTLDPLTWWDEPEKLSALYEYCKQDVRVEQELSRRLLPLSDAEQKLWVVDHAINQRGVYVDQPAISAAIEIVGRDTERLTGEIRRVTEGAVGSINEVAALTRWIQSRNVVVDGGIAKADVVLLLARNDLPSDVRHALLIRQEAAKTSTAKLSKMQTRISVDGRIKGTTQYHAAGTGRWGGRHIQPHNLPRPKLKPHEINEILEFLPRSSTDQAIARIDLLYGQPLSTISDCLRGMICAAPGHELIAVDYSNIEGRGIAWLAGEQSKLDAFRAADEGRGPGIYELAYAKTFHIPVEKVTKDQRQIGKVEELALGYQGGVSALQKMGHTYNVKLTNDEAAYIKQEWRAAHPRIEQYWYDLELAAFNAVYLPGTVFAAGPSQRCVKFRVKGSFLFCLLPSGRMLTYPYPKLKPRETPWGEIKEQVHYMNVESTSNKWVETHTYGGKLSENITQAISRDILAEAILRCEAESFPVVLHVHDEVVTELPEREAVTFESRVIEIVKRSPEWCKDLPIAVESWRGKRYRK
jgi:DNA polymerase